MPASRRAAWSSSSTRPRAEGFFDPKNPAGEAMPPRTSRECAPHRHPHRHLLHPRHRHLPAAPRPACRSRRPRLRQLRHRLQRPADGDRQLQRLQRLRHRERRRARACSRRWSAPAARATSRSTATCCSCRSNRPAAASTAARRACRNRSARNASAASASSTSPTSRNPKQVAAVQTCRGSHTHTLVPKDKQTLYVYGSGTGGVRSGEELAGLLRRRAEGQRRTRRSSAST